MTLEMILSPINAVLAKALPLFLGLFFAFVLLVAGWLLARGVEWAIITVLAVARLDKGAKQIGLTEILSKGKVKRSPTELIGALFYWLILFITIAMVANVFNLKVASQLLGTILDYIPLVLSAIFVLIIAAIVAAFLSSVIFIIAKNLRLESAKFLANTTRVAISAFAFIIALGQLGVQFSWLVNSMSYIVGAAGLALAIAFGMGAKDIVAGYLEELFE